MFSEHGFLTAMEAEAVFNLHINVLKLYLG